MVINRRPTQKNANLFFILFGYKIKIMSCAGLLSDLNGEEIKRFALVIDIVKAKKIIIDKNPFSRHIF